MVIKNLCILVLWVEEVLALEGLKGEYIVMIPDNHVSCVEVFDLVFRVDPWCVNPKGLTGIWRKLHPQLQHSTAATCHRDRKPHQSKLSHSNPSLDA